MRTHSHRLTNRTGPAVSVVCLLLLPAIGCDRGDPSAGSDQPLRSDSAGIEIVSNIAPQWAEDEGWIVDSLPSMQIGRQEGTVEQTLHGVVSVRDAADAILVAQETELRFYNDQGEFLQRLGGAGEGPGEFTRIAAALHCGDRTLVSELTPPRLTVFDRSGGSRTVPLPPPQAQGQLNPLAPLHACTASGVIGSLSGPRAPTSNPPVVQRNPGLVVQVQEADAQIDTLLSYAGSESFGGLRVPFGRATLIAATDTLLYVADTGEPQLRMLALDGTTRRIVRLALPEQPVTTDDIDRIREQYLDGLPPIALEHIQPLLDAVPIPSTMPFFSRIEVAPDGTIWLQAYQPFRDIEVTQWTVVDSNGTWLGDVELPPSFTVHEFGVRGALGVWRDELGVEYVRRYPIQR